MIDDSLAKTKWCPFAMTEVKKTEAFAFKVRDTSTFQSPTIYEYKGNHVAVASVNRTLEGKAHGDCLCITEECVFWRKIKAGRGDCSRFDDNMQSKITGDDSTMKSKWCPHARPENKPITEAITGNGASGKTIAIHSANRNAGNAMRDNAKCITKDCMAYRASREDDGYCMASDKNMQRK